LEIDCFLFIFIRSKMNSQKLKAHLQRLLPAKATFSTIDLKDAMRSYFPDAADTTLSWRINQLKKDNQIQQVGRGLYSFHFKLEYKPEINLRTKKAATRIRTFCSYAPIIWDTAMLNALSDDPKTLHWIFVEVGRAELDEIFSQALQFSKKLFANPDKETVNRYLLPVDDAIILIPQVSETPSIEQGDVSTLDIEGLLVNAYWHYERFFKPVGYEIESIFKNALDQYNVNRVKLLRFAARRDKRSEIEQLINTIAL
jgi:hypothetical protein